MQINQNVETPKLIGFLRNEQPQHIKIHVHHAQKPHYHTAQKKIHQRSSPIQSENSTQHRLKLKDYLRLTTITKRSNSNSIKKKKNELCPETVQVSSPLTKSPPKQAGSMLDTQKSLQILKSELQSDLNICLQKMNDLVNKVQNSNPRLQKQQQQYQQLVFMCELHRMVKETLMGNLDKASSMILQHKQKQIFKFASMAKQLLSTDIKKSSYNAKRKLNTTTRSRLVESSMIDHKNQNDTQIKSTFLLKL